MTRLGRYAIVGGTACAGAAIATVAQALRACWLPPDEDGACAGMQMSVRFAFNRDGGIIGEPRVTYTTSGVADDARQVYRRAITRAPDRCTPMPFGNGMGGAIAGRPIAIRYVDNRKLAHGHQP